MEPARKPSRRNTRDREAIPTFPFVETRWSLHAWGRQKVSYLSCVVDPEPELANTSRLCCMVPEDIVFFTARALRTSQAADQQHRHSACDHQGQERSARR